MSAAQPKTNQPTEPNQPAEPPVPKPDPEIEAKWETHPPAKPAETPSERTEAPPRQDSDALLNYHKAIAVAQSLAPEGVDIEDELNFVSGLSVDKDGNVTGEARYRPHPNTVPAPTPAAPRIAKPRSAAAAAPAKDDAYYDNLLRTYGL